MRRPPTAVLAASLILALALPVTGTAVAAEPRPASPHAVGGSPSAQPEARAGQTRLGQVLKRVNKARNKARKCGDDRYPAVRPIRRNARLDRAAGKYARLMARKDHFSHTSPNGDDPGDRISAAGYRWTKYGENIAAGYRSPASVMRGWLNSPGHCSAIMGRYRHIGLGYAFDADSEYGSYWVLDFASR